MKRILLLIVLLYISSNIYSQTVKVQILGRYKTDTLIDTGKYLDDNQYITLHSIKGNYVIGLLNNKMVYFSPKQLSPTREVHAWFLQQMASAQKNVNEATIKLYTAKYGKAYAMDVFNSKIKIGQPTKVVLAILGEPFEKHSDVSQGLITEKWYYTNRDTTKTAYCFFTNGRLVKFGN